jgi:ribosomal protein L9
MSNPKELRKALRNVVQELLPQMLTVEMEKAIYKSLEAQIKQIEENAKSQLKEMQERQKDTLSYLIRQVTVPNDKK